MQSGRPLFERIWPGALNRVWGHEVTSGDLYNGIVFDLARENAFPLAINRSFVRFEAIGKRRCIPLGYY